MPENATLLPLGGPLRPLRVAVIGSGPSGFYAAESLSAQKDLTVQVDMFDRLPTPYGLVRGGVAPDHQKIKSVILVYEKIAAKPGFRFFGNVRFGADISVEDVRRHYDAVIYAVGNESDKKMGIPGEDLPGSHSATAFVGWYNGHPDWRGQSFDLGVESVAVVGIGNVAMDVTRVLAEDPDELAPTDIAGYALAALRQSKVREIWLLGRRGPAQAAFSPAEIKEIGELRSSDLVVRPDEMVLDEASRKELSDLNAKKNVDYLLERSRLGAGSKPKKVRARFCASPVEVIADGGRVAALRIEKNKLVVDEKGNVKAKGTGAYETLSVGMVLRSVGYNGIPLPGVPFDPKSGHIPHKEGRVIEPATGSAVPGAYVVGWAKRGPSGLIGTNRADSVATVKALLEDVAGKTAAPEPDKSPEAALELIRRRQPRFVSFQDWKRLDQAELERGRAAGKIREKFTTLPEMLAAIGAPAPAGKF